MKPSNYPLCWPDNQLRNEADERQNARFSDHGKPVSIAVGAARVYEELEKLHATEWVISTNAEPRLDGKPRSDRKAPDDPGAAVWFKLYGEDRVLACDTWTTLGDNLAAIAAHIKALRGIERWGVSTTRQVFEAHRALPPKKEWWEVLGVAPTAGLRIVEAAYRELAKDAHPDRGGSETVMQLLNAARDTAREQLDPVRYYGKGKAS